MAIHLLPPVPPVPDTVPGTGPDLDPFWAAVRRRRPDLPLVLVGDAPGPGRGPAPELDEGRAR